MKTVSNLMIVWLLTILVMPSAASDRLPAIEGQPSEHGANPEISDPDRWKWIDQSDVPGVIHDVYFSEASQRRIGYNVFLPGSYEAQRQRRYPVVFYLHGRGGDGEQSTDYKVAFCSSEADTLLRRDLGYSQWRILQPISGLNTGFSHVRDMDYRRAG